MFGLSYRFAASLIAVSALASTADAQVTLHLATAQGDCVATTDASGLQLAPDGTNLQANGVVLSGSCGSGQGENFQPSLSVAPTSVTVGSDVTVNWQGGPDSTKCVYNGPRAGVDAVDWPAGDIACTGASCASVHTRQVTITAAGTYTFGLTCSNDTGAGSSNAVVATTGGGGGIQLTVPNTGSIGLPFTATWTAPAGATACTGSSTGPAALTGWTGALNLISPSLVTATANGAYTMSLTCTVAGQQVVSNTASITISTAEACMNPENRMTTGSVKYPTTGNSTRPGVDLTKFEQIWGHTNSTDTESLWPGKTGTNVEILNWNRTKFVAAKFQVPLNATPTLSGWLGVGTYFGQEMTLAISKSCGDFSTSNGVACMSTRRVGQSFNPWDIVPTNQCPLTPGETYYANIRVADSDACGATGTCVGITINNYWGQ